MLTPAAAPPEATDSGAARYRARVAAALDSLPAAADAGRVWSALGSAGLLAELYRADAEAVGVRADRLRALLTELDRRDDAGITLSVCVQVASALPLLLSAGQDLLRPMLDRLLSGDQLVALAATDAASAGSDLTGMSTSAELLADRVVLTGTKTWITNALTCSEFLVLARHRPGRHFTAFTWILVPAGAPGVQVRAGAAQAFAGAGIGDVEFDRVEVPLTRVVGRPGRGLASFAQHITRERLAGAQWALAMTTRALDQTRALLRSRSSDGTPLWDNPAVRQRFADALVRQQMLACLVIAQEDRLGRTFDATGAAVLKVAATQTAELVLSTCVRLQAAQGYLPGGAVRLQAEAAVFGIGGGTTDLMLAAIADRAADLLPSRTP
ncbi:MAG TPA: acyl-CoA dehydrogenase family protein [Jatrophihabitans sp.]|jgi:citronellyl-CoA dehydrogenase|uniref:acyl-CoA dehydrogenase family protein n=1 Tax=Jatrophihabitans sp. TaxID=1932789 RepID=UPI002EE23C45